MAYRTEKEEDGTETIVIDGWDSIADDPYSGTNRMRSVNLSVPKEVSVGYAITASATSGATLGLPISDSTRFFAYGSPGVPLGSAQSFAILDADGHVFESTSITGTWAYLASNSTLTNASSKDCIAYWLGYLFKFRDSNIDYWNGSTWSNGWATSGGGTNLVSPAVPRFAYVGTDNVLYFTNNGWVGAITLTDPSDPTSFNPADSGTYTVQGNKLQLPVTDMALSLAEVGLGSSSRSTLLIGGTQNAIYPWDKTSVSFGLPILVADSYIKLLVSVNQNVFIFPGNQQGRGRIFITNGSQADLYYKIPDYIFGEQDPYYVWGDVIFHRNNLVMGFFVTHNSGSGIIASDVIWALDLETKAFRGLSRIFTASTPINATCLISDGSLSSSGFGFIAGWNENNASGHIGYSGTTSGIGSGEIITDLIPVGTFTKKKTNSQIEYKLRSPLQSGENIVITPIIDGTSGTTLTFSPTPTTGSISGVANVTFQGAQWLQFDITLTGNSATSGVRLKELRIR